MNDKTLGEYKRTTPDPDETTGEALARLQAELTRLLDKADAELRDEADGGVAAAQIEKEAEARATICTDKDAHWRLDEALETIERLTRERDEARATKDMHKRRADEERARADAAESRPLTPDAITDEMVERARSELLNTAGLYVVPSSMRSILTAALTEPPARPEGAEDIEAWLDGMPKSIRLDDEHQRLFANHLAHMGFRVPVALAEVGLTEKNTEKENTVEHCDFCETTVESVSTGGGVGICADCRGEAEVPR